MTATLFRARFAFVCDHCDLGHRAGALCGFNQQRRLECAACLVGEDPDNDNALPVLDVDPRDETPPPATLFDQPAGA